MKNIYQTIKQTSRNYVLSTVLAGSLTLGSCTNVQKDTTYLPIDKETKTELQAEKRNTIGSLIKEGDNYINLANKQVIDMPKDKYVSIEEIKNALNSFNEAQDYYKKANKQIKEFKFSAHYNQKNFSQQDKKTRRTLNRIINGIDFEKPELQKIYERQGMDVKVENRTTTPEGLIKTSLYYLGIGGIIFGLGACRLFKK